MITTGLIETDGKQYSITPLGKSLAKHFEPLLDAITAIESNNDFWIEHDLSGIPEHLLDRINELKDCRVFEEEQSYVYDTHRPFVKNVLASKKFEGITTVFFSYWIDMFLLLAQKGVEISIIVTEDVLARIRNEYSEELEDGLNHPNAHMYVIQESPKIAFAVTDRFLSLSLFLKNGIYDPRDDLMGFDSTAIKWGKDLYKYCMERSIEVKPSHPMNEYISTDLKENVRVGLP